MPIWRPVCDALRKKFATIKRNSRILQRNWGRRLSFLFIWAVLSARISDISKIELSELSKRESERVEWKEDVAGIAPVVKTAVALANDYSNLGGGCIVCGARGTKDEHGFLETHINILVAEQCAAFGVHGLTCTS